MPLLYALSAPTLSGNLFGPARAEPGDADLVHDGFELGAVRRLPGRDDQ
ncbi:hypothetical protein ACH4TX_44980 [Streptomyces sp. NPDC021098]